MKAKAAWGLVLAVTLSGIASAAAFDDKEDLAKAGKKATEMKSYKFKMTIEMEGLPMMQGPIELSGEQEKDVTHITGEVNGNEIDAYKKGKKTANKNPESGEWERGGRGGRMGMNASQMKPPHEELKDVEKKFKEVKKSDKKETVNEKECTIYEGELTEDAAKEAIPGGGGRMMGGQAELTGKGKIFVDGDGIVRKVVFVSEIKASFQGQDLEITMTRSTDFSDIDKTEIKIPEEVAKLLEDDEKKPEEKKEDVPSEDKKDK